jgi:hypothetical protein
MGILHSLSPVKGIAFLRDFYAKESGKYYLATNREMLVRQLEGISDLRLQISD